MATGGGPSDRLGPGTAAYSLLTYADLPNEWRQEVNPATLQRMAVQLGIPVAKASIAVELPDYPWAWHYEAWSRTEIENSAARGENPLVVMVVSRDEFRTGWPEAQGQRDRLAKSVLRSLLQTGRPLPLFARIFGPPSRFVQDLNARQGA